MKTVAYSVIKNLAAGLADRTEGKLPTGEAALLRMALAEELSAMWETEGWPDLTDNLEELTLDASRCFSTREGAVDAMGRIVAVLEGGDPRSSMEARPVSSWTPLAGRVQVVAAESNVWVDWQLPAPDLMDATLIPTVAALDVYAVPAIFREALAYAGAAVLMVTENPQRASQLRGMSQAALVRQGAKVRGPWWRMAGR